MQLILKVPYLIERSKGAWHHFLFQPKWLCAHIWMTVQYVCINMKRRKAEKENYSIRWVRDCFRSVGNSLRTFSLHTHAHTKCFWPDFFPSLNISKHFKKKSHTFPFCITRKHSPCCLQLQNGYCCEDQVQVLQTLADKVEDDRKQFTLLKMVSWWVTAAAAAANHQPIQEDHRQLQPKYYQTHWSG